MVVVALGVSALACFNPSDVGGIEVLLNKPGVSYNLNISDGFDNVIDLGNAYVYRSHLFNELVISVFTQSLVPGSDEQYLTVRVDSPLVSLVENETVCSLSKELTSIPQVDFDAMVADGWYVEFLGNVSDEGYKAYVEWREGTSALIRVYMHTAGGSLYIDLITYSGSADVMNRVTEFASKYFNPSIEVAPEDITCSVNEYPVLQPKYSEQVVKEALEYELRWLRHVGVINGLGDDDIDEIIEVASLGNAGWNSRIVYTGSGWMTYSDAVNSGLIPGGTLLRGAFGCGFSVDTESLPEEAPAMNHDGVTHSVTVTPTFNGYGTLAVAVAIALAVSLAVYLIIKRF
jgi:hypothetical protein